MSNNTDYLWTEKWRPSKVEDCILPEELKSAFCGFVRDGVVPNMLLSGPPGAGKTTVAKALCQELGIDYMVINGSDEGRFLDTVRTQAKNFASTVSLETSGKVKVIIIDEADNTTNDVQLLLRASIESFHQTCRFIFTCNYRNRIIEPLQSRCTCLDFSIPSKEKPKIAADFMSRSCTILDEENIKYDKKTLALVIQNYFPDWRRVLNELQRYSVSNNGSIDTGILAVKSNVLLPQLVSSLKNKKYSDVRKWVVDNLDNDIHRIIRLLYDSLYDIMEPMSIPQAVMIFAKYDYQANFAVDLEIHLLACFTELMCECTFK